MRLAAAGICRLKCFCLCFCCTFNANPEPKIPCKKNENRFLASIGGVANGYSILLPTEEQKKCSFVQSLVTKIEHVPVLTGREESLNKRVNLALGHASVYFVVILCSTIHKTHRGQRSAQWTNTSKLRQMKEKLTAGRAKKEMANTEKHEATILPGQVLGTVSP